MTPSAFSFGFLHQRELITDASIDSDICKRRLRIGINDTA
jgi:hypothetical protein